MSDFSVSDEEWIGNGQGIEYIRLKMNGFVKDGEFGFDELQILTPEEQVGIVWYGDIHGESLESTVLSTTPQISDSERLNVTTVE